MVINDKDKWLDIFSLFSTYAFLNSSIIVSVVCILSLGLYMPRKQYFTESVHDGEISCDVSENNCLITLITNHFECTFYEK